MSFDSKRLSVQDSPNEPIMDETVRDESPRYPFSVVWVPIPLISWIIPMCGHLGICNSRGIIHDFAGSETVNIDDMLFGNPTLCYRILPGGPLTNDDAFVAKWDSEITENTEKYKRKNHYLIFSNCHSFVSDILRNLGYSFWTYNPVCLLVQMIVRGNYVHYGTRIQGFLRSVSPAILFWTFLGLCIEFFSRSIRSSVSGKGLTINGY
ncbi:hypothetical protein ACOME3_001882 [Neoechinorhynchus agilis]